MTFVKALPHITLNTKSNIFVFQDELNDIAFNYYDFSSIKTSTVIENESEVPCVEITLKSYSGAFDKVFIYAETNGDAKNIFNSILESLNRQ